MRGRKPIPTTVKLLRGNPGKRPLNDAEPKPSGAKPKCPAHLDAEAKKEWRRITKILEGMEMLHVEDGPAIAMYCTSWSRYREAQQKLATEGMIVLVGDAGTPAQSPYLAIANKAQQQMHQFLIEFGLTPSSRSRVKNTRAEKPKDEFEVFLGQKSG